MEQTETIENRARQLYSEAAFWSFSKPWDRLFESTRRYWWNKARLELIEKG